MRTRTYLILWSALLVGVVLVVILVGCSGGFTEGEIQGKVEEVQEKVEEAETIKEEVIAEKEEEIVAEETIAPDFLVLNIFS